MPNDGKKFEQKWRECAEKAKIFTLRIADSDMSFHTQRELRSRFTQKSPYDFLHYYRGELFCLELKHTKYKSISFQLTPDDTDGMIHSHQINSLVNASMFEGVHAGFIFNFRKEDEHNPDEDTYYMSIQDFSNFAVNTTKKSINKLDIVENGGVIIHCERKRTRFIYDVEGCFKEVLKL